MKNSQGHFLCKKWNPAITLFGFKLLVNVPKEELFAVARQSIERNGADYILANDLKDIGENQHIAYLVDKTREIQAQTKDEIAQLILNTLEKGEQNG